jgi:hypothetical protein
MRERRIAWQLTNIGVVIYAVGEAGQLLQCRMLQIILLDGRLRRHFLMNCIPPCLGTISFLQIQLLILLPPSLSLSLSPSFSLGES